MGIFEGFAAIDAATTAITTTIAVYIIMTDTPKQKYRSRRSPKFKRPALVSPICWINTTAWAQILACGTDGEFLIFANLSRSLFLCTLLPLFELERVQCNFGRSFRTKPKSSERNARLKSADLHGLSLSFLKSKTAMYQLCPLFGSILVWKFYIA